MEQPPSPGDETMSADQLNSDIRSAIVFLDNLDWQLRFGTAPFYQLIATQVRVYGKKEIAPWATVRHMGG